MLLVKFSEDFAHLRHVFHGVLLQLLRHLIAEEAARSGAHVAALGFKLAGGAIRSGPLESERKLGGLLLVVRRPSDLGRGQWRASSGLRSATHYLALKLSRIRRSGLLRLHGRTRRCVARLWDCDDLGLDGRKTFGVQSSFRPAATRPFRPFRGVASHGDFEVVVGRLFAPLLELLGDRLRRRYISVVGKVLHGEVLLLRSQPADVECGEVFSAVAHLAVLGRVFTLARHVSLFAIDVIITFKSTT